MERTWMNCRLFSKEHRDGVTEFMDFVSENLRGNQKILCPCRKCLNRLNQHKGDVEDHLLIYGMSNTYTRWIHHGEPVVMITENIEHLNEDIGCNFEHLTEDVLEDEPQDDLEDDEIYRMVHDLYPDQNHGPRTKSKFAAILEEMKQVVHPGSPYTRFSFMVKLLHVKSFYRISNVGFSAFLDLLSSAFPNCSIPASYAEAKNVIRALGLGYESIHVCPNNCVLFRKELAKKDACPICGASRWTDGDSRRKIPEKVLRHFPLIPRLKRMFRSKELSAQAQWHKLKRKPVDNELSHPADGEAWKDFDRQYEWFANDARNGQGSCWYKDDAFILATQATKVFYLDDNKHGEPWKVVQKFSHPHLWTVNEEENDDMQERGVDLTYQDDEQEISRVETQEGSSVHEQPVNKQDSISVDESLVDQIRRQRDLEVEDDLYNDDDDTIGQYDSENECAIMVPIDDGEYSDVE